MNTLCFSNMHLYNINMKVNLMMMMVMTIGKTLRRMFLWSFNLRKMISSADNEAISMSVQHSLPNHSPST